MASNIKHVMFDIETLGTEPESVVTSLGVVAFYKDGEVISSFETYFNIQQQLAAGMTVSGNTLVWWLKQSEEAKNSLVFGQEGRYNGVADMLINFDLWVADYGLKENTTYWANGASFDFPILEGLYSKFGEDGPPWKYYNQRCFRTIKGLPGANDVKPKREGVHHDALDDAKFQMDWLLNINELFDHKILE